MSTMQSAASKTAAGRRRIAGDRRRPGTEPSDQMTEPSVQVTEPSDQVTGPTIELPEHAEVLSSQDVPVVVPLDQDDEQTPAPPTAAPSGARPRSRWVVMVLAVCLVAVLAACLLAAVTTRSERSDVTAGDAALAAATSSGATILSYDYRHLDADFAHAAALTTGSFRTDYQATTAKAVQQLATQTQAVVVAKVVAGGVVSSSADRVTVLLFVNQTTTSNRLTSAKTDLNRVQMTMTRSGSHWLVSGLKAL